jgi:hypothetical protein
MTAQQTTTSNTTKSTIRFKVGDDLQVINKVISVLGLAPSDYTYNAKEGTITTYKTTITKEFIQQKVKELGFDFFLVKENNKEYKNETITTTIPYINPTSIDVAINALHKQYKYREDINLIETNINYIDKIVTVTAKAKIKEFSALDYKVVLILTNFSYVTNSSTFIKDVINELAQESKDRNKSTASTEQVTYDELYKSIDKLIDRVGSDFNKSAPPELKTFVKLFL